MTSAQNTDSLLLDSLLHAPQTLELAISTPQPRMKQNFTLSLDINHIRANIFQSLIGKVEAPTGIHTVDYTDYLTINVTPAKKGHEEIGPLVFTINNTKYTTTKISYDVADALPNTDRGVWIRKVDLEKNKFCIIIEQRIPATDVTTTNDNTIRIDKQPESSGIMKFKDNYSIPGLSNPNASNSTDFGSVEIGGETRQFLYAWAIHYFTINDDKIKIKISRDQFENIPPGYQFKDIIIQ